MKTTIGMVDFSGNPVLYPLIFDCKSNDIVVVMIQPLESHSVPKTADDIKEKISEITFTSTFRREMRAIAFSKKYIQDKLFNIGKLDRRIANTRIHIIHANEYIERLDPKSRYNASPNFLQELQDAGYECASNWLNKNLINIGKRETTNIVEMFS